MSAKGTGTKSSTTCNFGHISFILETLKAWNKLHGAEVDSLIDENSWGMDTLGIQ